MRKSLNLIVVAGALMALGACSSTTEQKAGAGAVAGAVVGGPVGAAVGGAAGAVAGHVQTEAAEKPHS
jgi:osmotically inducible lipoprotein OsmB